MSIERDEFGVPKFMGRDGAERYRVEFMSEDGTSSGVEYVDDIDGDALHAIAVGYGVSEFRIETPFMHEARRKKEETTDYRTLLFNMSAWEIRADVVMVGKYRDEWLEAMALELKIRDLVGDL